MLRYYDEVGLLTPAEVSKWTGHRLYSAEQIPRLNKILYLRDSGLNVSEIALALTMDEQSLLAQLDKKRRDRKGNSGREGKAAENRACQTRDAERQRRTAL